MPMGRSGSWMGWEGEEGRHGASQPRTCFHLQMPNHTHHSFNNDIIHNGLPIGVKMATTHIVISHCHWWLSSGIEDYMKRLGGWACPHINDTHMPLQPSLDRPSPSPSSLSHWCPWGTKVKVSAFTMKGNKGKVITASRHTGHAWIRIWE